MCNAWFSRKEEEDSPADELQLSNMTWFNELRISGEPAAAAQLPDPVCEPVSNPSPSDDLILFDSNDIWYRAQ